MIDVNLKSLMTDVKEIETEIQAILEVKLRRELIKGMVGTLYPRIIEAEIKEIQAKFPISKFSRNYNPREP